MKLCRTDQYALQLQ